MADSITVPFDQRSSEEMQEFVYGYIQEQFPEWVPQAGNLEVILTEAMTQLLFELFTLAADVPPEHLAYLGKLIRIDRLGAVAATALSTWTANDTNGHTIPADTLVGWGTVDDTIVGFSTVNEVTIPPGSLTTAAGAITIQCTTEGVVGNGFSGSPELITLLDFVNTVTVVAPTSGGREEENLTAYLARLSKRLQLLADRPIREDDVAIWVTTVLSGISRAICFDNYNGLTNTPDQERCCTVVGHDTVGNDLLQAKIDELMAALALTREVNFDFYYKHPTRTTVGVRATIYAEPGVDIVALQANVKAALIAALDPTVWGQPISAQGPSWRNELILRVGWVYAQIVKVEGVRYIESSIPVELRANGGAWVSTDLNLAGLAPLTGADLANLVITVLPSV